ncbi:MAG: proline dehydrogenase family protein [Chloroflexota bacterium]|nr:proline dehydrogenase family protein [Chloroflexota bacterium]
MLRQILVRLSQQPQLRDFATHNGMARGMAERFVAGETLEKAIAVVRDVNARAMSATLDHLGENVTSKQEAIEATNAACSMLAALISAGVDCNASLKLTQLGLDLGDELARENLRRILDQAAESDTFIRIDMESSEYVDRTLDIFYRLFETYQNVGVVLQACLYRSAGDLERLIQSRARVRLVKGAYLEPAPVAFQQKVDVDANFVKLTEMLLADANYPAIATHDPTMIAAAKRFAAGHQIAASSFEFQMLYGIRRDLQTGLGAEGYRMRIYIPYGSHWYPYLMRRMAERPANVMFVLGSIAREVTARGT